MLPKAGPIGSYLISVQALSKRFPQAHDHHNDHHADGVSDHRQYSQCDPRVLPLRGHNQAHERAPRRNEQNYIRWGYFR